MTMIMIKDLQINKILALNNPQESYMQLNKSPKAW